MAGCADYLKYAYTDCWVIVVRRDDYHCITWRDTTGFLCWMFQRKEAVEGRIFVNSCTWFTLLLCYCITVLYLCYCVRC